jgi:hypothetical protein
MALLDHLYDVKTKARYNVQKWHRSGKGSNGLYPLGDRIAARINLNQGSLV